MLLRSSGKKQISQTSGTCQSVASSRCIYCVVIIISVPVTITCALINQLLKREITIPTANNTCQNTMVIVDFSCCFDPSAKFTLPTGPFLSQMWYCFLAGYHFLFNIFRCQIGSRKKKQEEKKTPKGHPKNPKVFFFSPIFHPSFPSCNYISHPISGCFTVFPPLFTLSPRRLYLFPYLFLFFPVPSLLVIFSDQW